MIGFAGSVVSLRESSAWDAPAWLRCCFEIEGTRLFFLVLFQIGSETFAKLRCKRQAALNLRISDGLQQAPKANLLGRILADLLLGIRQ